MKENLKLALFLGTFLALLIGGSWYGYHMDTSPVETSTGVAVPRAKVKEYEQGAAAFRAGVPSTANPHAGAGGVFGQTQPAERWLQGWMDAKAQAATKE